MFTFDRYRQYSHENFPAYIINSTQAKSLLYCGMNYLNLRTICFFIFCMVTLSVTAQKKEAYYDYSWKPADPLKARFYSTVEKTDSGWFRNDYFLGTMKLQMQALYEDSSCEITNGRSVFFYANGKVSSVGRMVHDKNEGVCLSFYYNGMMSDSALYHNGRPVGNRMGWHRNGIISDSIVHVNDSVDVAFSWFDNGVPSAAGYVLKGRQNGKWQYFHRTGGLAALEVYQNGKLVSAEYHNEDGTTHTDTAKSHRPASFKGGVQGWLQYLQKNLYWPSNLQFSNGDMAVVVVDMVIGEDGKVESADIDTPFHPAFDDIALKIVKNSPPWQPAISHNRRVKSHFRQPVTFRQTE